MKEIRAFVTDDIAALLDDLQVAVREELGFEGKLTRGDIVATAVRQMAKTYGLKSKSRSSEGAEGRKADKA